MLAQQIINGLALGSTYALTAIGYTLVFGILELVNFSHGAVYMSGTFFTLLLWRSLHLPLPVALVLGILVTGLLGLAIDKTALRPLRNRQAPKVAALVSTIGISMILQNAVQLTAGSQTQSFPQLIPLRILQFGNVRVTTLQIFMLAASVTLMGLLLWFIQKSKTGKAMRATAQNMEAARLMGINVDRIISITFYIGSAMAAVAGVMVGMYYQSADASMGFMAGLKAFSAAVLGGIGILPGAMLGGLLLGMTEMMAGAYLHSGLRDAVAFAVLILVLLVKPTGLLGKPEQTKV